MDADFSAHASMLSSVQNHCKIYTQVPATIQSSASFPVWLCSWVAGTIIMSSSRSTPVPPEGGRGGALALRAVGGDTGVPRS